MTGFGQPRDAAANTDTQPEVVASPTALHRLLREHGAASGAHLPGDPGRGNKYNARRTEYAGQIYDSKVEAQRAAYLDTLLAAGQITALRRQHPWLLLFRPPDQLQIRYVSDFDYHVLVASTLGPLVVEEVKSRPTMTAAWRLKAKLFRYEYPAIRLMLVRLVDGAWQEEVWLP